MTNHFQLNQNERRLKNASSADFAPACLCGNGDAHAKMTRNVRSVDCPACVEIIASKPDYLAKPVGEWRAAYMDGLISHEDYYRSIVAQTGIVPQAHDMLRRTAKALLAGDEHLNTIPLRNWDIMAGAYSDRMKPAFKRHGDFFTHANAVCVMKTAFRDAVTINAEKTISAMLAKAADYTAQGNAARNEDASRLYNMALNCSDTAKVLQDVRDSMAKGN